MAGAVLGLSLPPFLVTNSWLDLLGQGGLWRAWLPVNIYGLGGTVWILTLLLWPVALILGIGGIQRLEPSLFEADPALGGWPLVRYVIFPAMQAPLGQAAVVIFALALNNFAVPAILQTKVFPAEMWVSFNTTFDYAGTLKLTWPLVVFPVLLLLWFRRVPVHWPRVEGRLGYQVVRDRLGRRWFACAGAITMLQLLLSVAIPLGQLALRGRTWAELPGALGAGQSAIQNSFVFAVAASVLCGVLGLLLWRWRTGALLWLLFLSPGVLLGMGLIYLFNRGVLTSFYQSVGIVLAALSLRYLALSWAGTRHAMRSLDESLVDFARLHGASAWQLFRHVQWPQVAPELATVCLVTYLLGLWDVETLVLIIPPGCETLALRIFNLLHYGHNAQVNALCVLLLALAVAPLLLASVWWFRRGFRPGAVVFTLCCLMFCDGCQRAGSNHAVLQSKIFSRVEVIGSRGTALGQFNKPRSVAVDAKDNLYVVDMTGRVQKFSSNGVYLASWQMPQTEKGKPKGMCRDASGDIVVVEPHYTRVNHFTPDGKLLAQWGAAGTNAGQLCLPRAAAVNSHGNILVCEYTLVDRVQEFSARGAHWLRTIGQSGLGPGQFNRPEGLCVDAQDRIYVADSCNHRIQVFSPEGKFLRAYGHAGSGVGELSYPYDIQVDAKGLQFVIEFGNSRIQIFDQDDKPLEIVGRAGAAPGQFSNPWSAAFDSAGNLYVVDSQNHRVQKFIRRS